MPDMYRLLVLKLKPAARSLIQCAMTSCLILLVVFRFYLVANTTDVSVGSRNTSEMIHHHGASLSEQHTADLLIYHGTQ